MILIDQTKQEYRKELRNVTHVDGSSRLQTIQKEWNPALERLLRKFHHITCIPVLLNTSFNKKGMPIVELPEQAQKLFDETALDILVINDTWIAK
jgi:carbamoyltransferase